MRRPKLRIPMTPIRRFGRRPPSLCVHFFTSTMSSKNNSNKRSCVELQEDELEKLQGLSEEEVRSETKRAYSESTRANAAGRADRARAEPKRLARGES